MLPFFLHAKTISDAWFRLIYTIWDYGYRQQIQKGSFENQECRIQFPGMMVYIEHPGEDMIPVIPPGLSIPAPTTMEYIESYFVEYLMNPNLSPNETYRYSSRIHHPMPKGGTQFERIVEILKKTPYTNQATIEVGSPDDYDLCVGKDQKLDPPCLRLIDFKVFPGGILSLNVFFRSWDLWAGFPTNLGGLELLKRLVASETDLQPGPTYAYSSGAHLYGYQEEIARLRTNRVESDEVMVDETKFKPVRWNGKDFDPV